MSGHVLYLDSSALVKLVLAEPESEAVSAAVSRMSAHASSIVARVEVSVAARRAGPDAARRADEVLAVLDVIPLDEEIADAARTHFDPSLRALDAIHLASAIALGDDLAALLTFDRRQREAAADQGLPLLPE